MVGCFHNQVMSRPNFPASWPRKLRYTSFVQKDVFTPTNLLRDCHSFFLANLRASNLPVSYLAPASFLLCFFCSWESHCHHLPSPLLLYLQLFLVHKHCSSPAKSRLSKICSRHLSKEESVFGWTIIGLRLDSAVDPLNSDADFSYIREMVGTLCDAHCKEHLIMSVTFLTISRNLRLRFSFWNSFWLWPLWENKAITELNSNWTKSVVLGIACWE